MKVLRPLLLAAAALPLLSCNAALDAVRDCGDLSLTDLRKHDYVDAECRAAIQHLLPFDEDDFTNNLVAIGSGKFGTFTRRTVVFVAATNVSGNALSLQRSELNVRAVTVGGDTVTLDTLQYAVKKLKEIGGAKISISSVIDYSSSMTSQDLEDASRIYRDLFTVLDTAGIPFESNVYLFSNKVTQVLSYTSDADTLRAHLVRDNEYPRDLTALYDAIGVGIQSLSTRSGKLKLLVVTTDGAENESRTYKTPQALYALAAKHKVRVVVLGSLFADPDFMRDMARNTGGFYVYNRTLLTLKAQFLKAATMMANTAALEFKSLPESTATVIVERAGKKATFRL